MFKIGNKRAATKAFLASFLVYFVPMILPHAVAPFGLLWIGFLKEGGDPLWLVGNLVTGLLLQLVAGTLWYWFFIHAGWKRFVGVVVVAPLFVVGAEVLFLVVLPSLVLIEGDNSPEQTGWAVECTAEDVRLSVVRTPADLSVERVGQTWVRRPGREIQPLGLLSMPGCEVTDLELDAGRHTHVRFAVRYGKALYTTYEGSSNLPTSQRERWWFYPGAGAESIPLDGVRSDAILSNDGEWLAWIERSMEGSDEVSAEFEKWRQEAGTTGDAVHHDALLLELHLRSILASETRVVSLTKLRSFGASPISLDMSTGELTVYANRRGLAVVGLDGSLKWGPIQPDGLEVWSRNFLRVGEKGWVVWKDPDEMRASTIVWSLPHGPGSHRVAKGRRISSLSVDAAGRHIGLSVGGRYNFGTVRDSVYILRAADGSEAFRRYFPQYTRPNGKFIGSDYFVVTEVSGGLRVLRVPEG